MILFTCSISSVYFSSFVIAQMQGDKFTIIVIFGVGFCLGMIVGALLLSKKVFDDYVCYILAQYLIFTSILIPFVIDKLPETAIYVLFFFRMIGCGICINLQYIIIGTRLNPLLLGTSLEICFCFANLMASIQPVVANLKEPIPLINAIVIFTFGVTTASSFRKIPTNSINVEQTIVS